VTVIILVILFSQQTCCIIWCHNSLGSQQSWNFSNCKVVLKFEIVLKSPSFSTNVLILNVVVRAEW